MAIVDMFQREEHYKGSYLKDRSWLLQVQFIEFLITPLFLVKTHVIIICYNTVIINILT